MNRGTPTRRGTMNRGTPTRRGTGKTWKLNIIIRPSSLFLQPSIAGSVYSHYYITKSINWSQCCALQNLLEE